MAVNLIKGQKVNLIKNNGDSLRHAIVGLGWDQVEQKRGFFARRVPDIDCDASAILCVDGKAVSTKDVVYFGRTRHASGTVVHTGDNLTGAGEGDDEQIIVHFDSVPARYDKIIFVVNIYQAKERRQHFGMIRNAFIRIVDQDDNQELCRYDLSDNYDGMTAMVFGEAYRRNGAWKFSAIGQATRDNSISELYNRFV